MAATEEPVKTVGIVAKPRLEAVERAVELRAWLRSRGRTVYLDDTTSRDVDGRPGAGPDVLRACDLLVVIGGDGTMIHAAHLLDGASVPVFGIHAGYLGFLTDTATGEPIHALLDAALEGRAPVEERLLFDVSLLRDGQTRLSGRVVNDAVVSKAALARIADIGCWIDGREVAEYRADGLIVATPTGSTAYSLSAGGPILYPTLDAMILAPICPHTLSQRPLVLPATGEVRLRLLSDNGEMFLTLDGQMGEALAAGDEVLVRPSTRRLKLVRNPRADFFGVLRSKLHWG